MAETEAKSKCFLVRTTSTGSMNTITRGKAFMSGRKESVKRRNKIAPTGIYLWKHARPQRSLALPNLLLKACALYALQLPALHNRRKSEQGVHSTKPTAGENRNVKAREWP